jgi:hypothetical protein
MTDWLQIECGCCAGLQWGGEYPRECLDCDGTGLLWVSPKDRLKQWPQGPFLGSEPGRYRKEVLKRERQLLVDRVISGCAS